jgi:hypothetical protein
MLERRVVMPLRETGGVLVVLCMGGVVLFAFELALRFKNAASLAFSAGPVDGGAGAGACAGA